jgi:outer membrane protein OmpA-like peptidoglycan-associated protein
MKKIYILFAICLLAIQTASSQTITHNNVKFQVLSINKDNSQAKIDLKIILDDLAIGTSDMLTLTPILRSQDGKNEVRTAPVVITGKQRSITLERAIDMESYLFEAPPRGIYRRYNRKPQSIDIAINAIHESWVDKCDLIFVESVACCGLKTETEAEYKVLSPVFAQKAPAEYKLSYITPPVEEVKQRSETYSAQLNFRIGKDSIEYNLENNAEILEEIDTIIRNVKENDNLSDIEFRIVGYASPEGDQLTNMKLAQDRSKAFAYYLTQKYEIPATSLKLDWMGDDWAGLYKAVEKSDKLTYKNEILKALETNDPVRRKTKLRQIAGGKAYNTLVNEFYPPLRRNEYTISYVARNFNLEEARQQLQQNPQHLSLNEMFAVANSYPKSSVRFKEVFEIAARIYPENLIAMQNAVATDIENGNYDNAISRLESIDSPEANNNLGVAYAKKGNFESAIICFEKAIEQGNIQAIENKMILEEK